MRQKHRERNPFMADFPAQSNDYFQQHLPVIRSNNNKFAKCNQGCKKRDFQRAPHLQAVMDRIERRRQLDREAADRRKGGPKRDPNDISDLLEIFAKYDNILEHLAKKNTRLKEVATRHSKDYQDGDLSSSSSEDLLNDLDDIKEFQAKKFAQYLQDDTPKSPEQRNDSYHEKTYSRGDAANTMRQPSSPVARYSSPFSIPERPRGANSSDNNNKRPTTYSTPEKSRRAAYLRFQTQRLRERNKARTESCQAREEEQEALNGRSWPQLNTSSCDFCCSFGEGEDEDEPVEKARQLKTHVNELYQQSQELRDSENAMRKDLSKMKLRYLKRHRKIQSNYARSLGIDYGSGEDDTTSTEKTEGGGSSYRIENGVIILDDDAEERIGNELKEKEKFPLVYRRKKGKIPVHQNMKSERKKRKEQDGGNERIIIPPQLQKALRRKSANDSNSSDSVSESSSANHYNICCL